MGPLAAILLQVVLADETSAPLPDGPPTVFAASPGGAWLAVGGTDRVHVLDGRTLKPAAVLEVDAQSAAFDEADRALTLAGSRVVRIETGTWKGLFRAGLPDVAPTRRVPAPRRLGRFFVEEASWSDRRLPPVVLARPEGDVYYLAAGGTLRRARILDGALDVQDLGGRPTDVTPNRPTGLLALAGIPVVELESLTGIVLRGKPLTLTLSLNPIDAAGLGGRVALVTPTHELVYDAVTWRVIHFREIRDGAALAVAAGRAWAFTSDADGLHAWRPDVPGRRIAVGPRVERLAVDSAGTALFAVDGGRIRRWRIEAP